VAPAPKVGRPAADDLESLRLEIEALRRELRATKETVRELQAEVRGKKEIGVRQERDLERLRRLDTLKLEGEKLHRLEALRLEEAAKAGLNRKDAADPLTALENAVKRLRKDPKDKGAAEALDRAMKRLRGQSKPNKPGQQGTDLFGR